MILATGKQVFCQFHCTCWFPSKQHEQEKARTVWAELPKEASRVTTAGHCSYSQECPALCLALGIFSTNRGQEERQEEITSFLVKTAERPGGGAGAWAGHTEGSGSERRAISQKGAPVCGLVALCCAPTTPGQRGPSPVPGHTWHRGPAGRRTVCRCLAGPGAVRGGGCAALLPSLSHARADCVR